MSKRPVRGRRDSNRSKSNLTRRLDTEQQLVRAVPRLSADVLHQLIQHRGLDACGSLLAAATPQQIKALLDLDLWRTTPGRDDRFDERRFGSWLETLMDEGEAVAARVVAAMDPDVAIAGLSRYVRVFDPGIFEPTASSDDDAEDFKLPRSRTVECEIGGYVVRARTAFVWDAIVGLLSTLATERPDCFHALMQGCRRLSDSTPEADGLDDLLLEPEQLLHDVSLDREGRRSQQGYLTPGDARAFLRMARQPRTAASPINAIATAYFRSLEDAAGPGDEEPRQAGPAVESEAADSIDAVADLLAEVGIASPRPRALLGPASTNVACVTPIQPLMEYVHDTDDDAYFARSSELGFLANALLAGCSVHDRPFTAQEAWDAAVGICNLGLEIPKVPEAYLVDHDLVTAFEAGWRLLHDKVSMFVTERLIATLADVRSVDPDMQRDLHRLCRELTRGRDAGTPWQAREALEVIAILDMPTWACLRGLLNECPVLPAALPAIVDGHARSVSATAFECFATSQQIQKVHAFAEKLGDALLYQ